MTHADAGMSAYSVGPPEPVYEYRVVCSAGPVMVYMDGAAARRHADMNADRWVERRSVGPWEAI